MSNSLSIESFFTEISCPSRQWNISGRINRGGLLTSGLSLFSLVLDCELPALLMVLDLATICVCPQIDVCIYPYLPI